MPQITLGCTVTASVGPEERKGKRKRKRVFTGTVIASQPRQQWTVFWDDIGRCSTHPSRSLKFLEESTQTLEGLNVDHILETRMIEDPSVQPLPPIVATVTDATDTVTDTITDTIEDAGGGGGTVGGTVGDTVRGSVGDTVGGSVGGSVNTS